MQLNGSVSSPLIARLRRDLITSSFTVETVGELWGEEAAAALFRGQRLPAVRALRRRRVDGVVQSKAETLAAVFVLNVPVSREQLDDALPQLGSRGAEQLGLVGPASGQSAPGDHAFVSARLDLRPYSFVDNFGAGSWWIVSDLGETALGRPLDVDHVLGVGGASMTLSGLMLTTHVGSVLDLGTGCGIQAMHASRHAERVVATDISARALELAALNAELNAIDNIEFRLGSLYEPVAGERFDQIVSNPPFVITPRTEGVPLYEYRDAGLVGDALVAAVIRGAEQHLAEGGVAQLLGNWEYRAGAGAGAGSNANANANANEGAGGEGSAGAGAAGGAVEPSDGLDRVSAWTSETNLDAWVIERELQDAAQYAETWIRDGGTRPGTQEFDELYAAWLDDFDSRSVKSVGFGYVLLRRRAAPPSGGSTAGRSTVGRSTAGSSTSGTSTSGTNAARLRRFERLTDARGSNPAGLGQYFEASLAGFDWQSAQSDNALLGSTVTYAHDVTEERHYWPGQENPTVMTLRQGSGFARSVSLDTALAALVGACDGDLALGQIIGALAHLLEADETELVADLLPRVRGLVNDAFLVPQVE
ncbi:DUF7059 domain-containing protein [Subtercola frigoramans]|uniref:DUF7059 domain-containing protein n=1 Tax=Subtercola frigoramans TaxID=120298 RepID=UPI001960E93A